MCGLENYCNKIKECGHECDGVRGEPVCVPCLHPDCGGTSAADKLKKEVPYTVEDDCGICFSGLEESPCYRLCQTHIFHASCIERLFKARWSTMSISFAYLSCPGCKVAMDIPEAFPVLGALFQTQIAYKANIEKMSIAEATRAGLRTSPKLKDEDDEFYNNFKGLALASCTFYECNACKTPYFGGMIDCR